MIGPAQTFGKGDIVRKKRNPGMAASVVDGPIDDAGISRNYGH